MVKRSLLVAALMFPAFCWGQIQLWSETYDYAQIYSLLRVNSGDVLAIGTDLTEGNKGLFWEVNQNGGTNWNQLYYSGLVLIGGATTPQGEYIAVGLCLPNPFFPLFAGWVIVTDSLGVSLWQRSYGDPESANNYVLYSVCGNSDGTYTAGGEGESDFSLTAQAWAIKFCTLGDTLWSRLWNIGQRSEINNILIHPEGGYFAGGNVWISAQDTTSSPVIFRISEDGDTLWTRRYDFPVSVTLNDLVLNPSGGFVGVGFIESPLNPSITQGWLAHFDENGDTLDFIIHASEESSAYAAVQPAPDFRWILAGNRTIQGNTKALVTCCESDGNTIWSQTYAEGNYCWTTDVVVDDSSNIYCGGSANYTGSNVDAWVFKVSTSNAGVNPNQIACIPETFNLSAFPNPFNPTTMLTFTLPHPAKVSLEVFDINGRLVGQPSVVASAVGKQGRLPYREMFEAGTNTIPFDGTGLPSGIYLARLAAGEYTGVQKLVLLK